MELNTTLPSDVVSIKKKKKKAKVLSKRNYAKIGFLF